MRTLWAKFGKAIARPLLHAVSLLLLISAAFLLIVPETAYSQIWVSSGFKVSSDGKQEIATCSTSAVNPTTSQSSPAAADYNTFLASCTVTPSNGAPINSAQCPGGAEGSVLNFPYGNPTGQCAMTFQPQPNVTYTLNSAHALEFNLDPFGTGCGQFLLAACFSDPLGYYAYPWRTESSYPGVISNSSAPAINTVDETCTARGGTCAAQNIPSEEEISPGVFIYAPEYWYLAQTSEPWQVRCSDVVQGSVTHAIDGSSITATFTPNFGFSLAQAAQVCHFADFDWVQTITHIPDPGNMWARNNGGAFDPLVNGPVRLTSGYSGRVSDPPQGGGYSNPNPILAGSEDDSYPFYCNVAGDADCEKTANTLSFGDQPKDSCLVDASGNPSAAYLNRPEIRANCQNQTAAPGSFIGFTTHLAGVTYPDGAGAAPVPVDLGIGVTWTTNFNGSVGGITNTSKSIPGPVDPGSGSGGITLVSVNETTNYEYPRLSDGVPLAALLTQISTTVSNPTFNRVNRTIDETVTIKNDSDSTIIGPFQVVLDSLEKGFALTNATGTFGGWPYITVPSVDSLEPGQSASVDLQFSIGPTAIIKFTPLIYSGSFD